MICASATLRRLSRLAQSRCAAQATPAAMPTEPQALEDNQLFGQKLVNQPDLPSSASPALRFQVQAQDGAQARAAQMELPHFVCETPMFMPVGTKGAQCALERA